MRVVNFYENTPCFLPMGGGFQKRADECGIMDLSYCMLQKLPFGIQQSSLRIRFFSTLKTMPVQTCLIPDPLFPN